jgi:uncharacterized protein YbaA (DUF1428 family)
MAHYVEGFVIPLPKKNLNTYRRLAQKARQGKRSRRARIPRCVGDDLNVEMGLSFPRGIKTKPDETVLFSYIVFKSRAHRDRVNTKVMKDPRMLKMMKSAPMPFAWQTDDVRRIQEHRRSLTL